MQEESFSVFKSHLEVYLDLWERGLKKCANRELAAFMERFDRWQPDRQKEVLLLLCREICDKGNSQYHAWRSGMPYALWQRVESFLRCSCESGSGMPYLRWRYELCGRDRTVLQEAYIHPCCDEKTLWYCFCEYLEDLSFGAHHFPECCLLEVAQYEKILSCCEELLARYDAPNDLRDAYAYFKALYCVWWQYEKDQSKDFYALCQAAFISFKTTPVYQYKASK